MADLTVVQGGRAVVQGTLESSVPPYDEGAEMSIVLSAMIDPARCTEALALLREEHFFCRPHRLVFRALMKLTEAGQPADMVSVLAWLRTDGRLGEWGSARAFTESFDACIGLTQMERAATIVRDAWRMRELANIARLTIAQIVVRYDAQELLDAVSARVFALAGDAPSFTATDSKTLALALSRKLTAAREPAAHGLGVVSGFPSFDAKVLPFLPGSMTIVGARPGVGKTSFLLGLVLNAARRGDLCYFATCEMPSEQLLLRCACMVASVSYQDVVTNRLTMEAQDRLFDALSQLSALPVVWDSLEAPTVPLVRAKVERVRAEYAHKGHRLKLVVVDYMGKMRPTGCGSNATTEEQAANIAINCKNAAKKTDLPWILAAQLNRKLVENGKTRRPQVTDLRGSGVIEAEADTVLLIHRDDHAREQQFGDNHVPNREADIIVGKQRNGASPTVTLRFVREFTRFEDAT